ncbi:hypothetical protein BKA56DRAFT_604794 [Ilyonectria sp. MPI-CAGE-AT-0026]|nr:hypothetical protein BKA56DRAFT_604794 [Ilyonectria sp. MPI-CAGE-AT-0026]
MIPGCFIIKFFTCFIILIPRISTLSDRHYFFYCDVAAHTWRAKSATMIPCTPIHQFQFRPHDTPRKGSPVP